MTNERPVPVETGLGVLGFGRDSIIVDHIDWNGGTISISCRIDSDHLDGFRGEHRDIEATIAFDGVVSMFHAELDTYAAIRSGTFTKVPDGASNLERIEGSRYQRDLPTRPDWGTVVHFRLWTYDDVFDILAKSVSVTERRTPTH